MSCAILIFDRKGDIKIIFNHAIMKNLDTLWVGLSFLALGLIVGILVASPGSWLGGDDGDVLQAAAEQEAAMTDEEIMQQFLDDLSVVSDVSVDDDAMLGDADAPVTIVEFSDFQCPYCAKFVLDTYPELKTNYIDTGLVKFVFRDYPLPSHTNASVAAEAAECAGEYGDDYFFQMHDMIFENMSEWSYADDAEGVFLTYADEIGVDIGTCLENDEMAEEVADDFSAGRAYGVSGTPSFFVNDKMLVGAYPYEYFEALIEYELSELE